MEEIKLFDGELKLMELLWESGGAHAKDLSLLAAQRIGWNKNTTYTVLKKLVAKRAVAREEPGFVCTPLVSREQVVGAETAGLIDRFYQGSAKRFFASFLGSAALSPKELEELSDLIRQKKEE